MAEKHLKGKKDDKRAKNDKRNFFGKIGKFLSDCKAELKKIIWPTPRVTFKNTGVVLVSIIVCGTAVGLFDAVVLWGLSHIMTLAK